MKSAKEKALNSMPEGVLGLQPLVHKALDIAIKEAKREEAKKWQQKIRQLEKYETENVLKAKKQERDEIFYELNLILTIFDDKKLIKQIQRLYKSRGGK